MKTVKNISVFTRIPNVLKELRTTLPHLNFIEVSNDNPVEQLNKTEVVVADYDKIAPYMYDLPNVRWVQGTWAGVEKFVSGVDRSKALPFTLTRFSDINFGRLMSEYVVAFVVNHERELFRVYENQKQQKWDRSGTVFVHRNISDLTVGILGVGTIGAWVGKVLSFLGGKVIGYGRRATIESTPENSYLSEYHNSSQLPEFLKKCDYIVNILPSTLETNGLLNGNVLENCQEKKPVFINIGRGSIVSETDLITALENKWLSYSILDVFDTEPLPKESALWTNEKIFITPHCSGVTRAKYVAELFRDNLKLYEEGKPLPAAVDVNRGY